MSRVLAVWTRHFLDENRPGWREQGLALQDPDALRGDAPTIPHADMVAVWTGELADPMYGIHFAERHADQALGLLSDAGSRAETVGDALRTLVRLQRLIDTDNETTLAVNGELATLAHRPPASIGTWPAHLAESCLAAAVHLLRGYTGRSLPLHSISFQHADRGVDRVAAWFGCPVHYGQSINSIVLDRAALALTSRNADRTVLTAILSRAARELAERTNEDSFMDRARRIVRERLGESLTVASLARSLQISTRSLQRRLGEHRTTFRTLVDEARLELLQTSADRTGAAAAKVGYFDASSLRRLRRRSR